MKTKKKQKTIQSRYIIFATTFVYNLVIGIYLKDFLVLSPILIAFYLLSILPTVFWLVGTRLKGYRAVIYILLFVTMLASILFAYHCRRLLPRMTFVLTAMEMLYLAIFGRSGRKDKLLTKIFTLIVSGLLVAAFCTTYIFVCKCDNVPLANGRATLWDAETVKLADEICEAVKPTKKRFEHFMIGSYATLSTTTTAILFSNTLMFVRYCKPSKVFALTFPICLPQSEYSLLRCEWHILYGQLDATRMEPRLLQRCLVERGCNQRHLCHPKRKDAVRLPRTGKNQFPRQ